MIMGTYYRQYGSKQQSGFSLLELSIILIIVGVLSAMGAVAGLDALKMARRVQTQNKLDTIEAALMAMRNNASSHRLPCPGDETIAKGASGYGDEADNPGICAGGSVEVNNTDGLTFAEGSVPVNALNLPEDFMYDGWGRKFVYAVDLSATEFEAFSSIDIDDYCSITVKDAAGDSRTTIPNAPSGTNNGAIYALLSTGENGHGGYNSSGSRISAGSTNGDEQANCHCDSSASDTGATASFIQKEPVYTDNTNQFDDVVRFKMRWQMINRDDENEFAGRGEYRGADLVLGLTTYNVANRHVFKNICGRYVAPSDTSEELDPVPGADPLATFFTVSNNHIIQYSDQSGNDCYFYPVSGTGTTTGTNGALSSCPGFDSSIRFAASSFSSESKTTYLAATQTTSGYMNIWRINAGATVVDTLSIALSGQPSHLSITEDYLLIPRSSTSLYLYKRVGNTYNFPSVITVPSGTLYDSALSPDGRYIVASVEDGSDAKIYIWKDDGITLITTITHTGGDSPGAITFSPDGNYFVVAGDAVRDFWIYKVDDDTFNLLATPSSWANLGGLGEKVFAFSPNANFLFMGSAASPYVSVFRRTGARSYRNATGQMVNFPSAPISSIAHRH